MFGNNKSERKSSEAIDRNNFERMEFQRTSTEVQRHSQMLMIKIELLHMGEDDHCKGDGCHMAHPP